MNSIAQTHLFSRKLLAVVCLVFGFQLNRGSLGAAVIDWDGSTSATFSTGTNWFTNAAPTNNTTTDIARFGNIAFTNQPNLGAARSINGLQFTSNVTVTLSGASLLTIGGSGIDNQSTSGTQTVGTPLSLGAAQSFTNSGNLAITGNVANGTNLLTLTGSGTGGSISGIIGNGSGGITKSGTGTWTLSGLNTFTGATTINAGTLSVATIGNGGVAGNLGQATNAAGNLVLGGGTLQYTGATASTNRNFTLTTGTTSSIDVSTGATNLTISGASTNTTGGLTKLGAGTLTLSGANLYTGLTTVNAGTLAYGAANALSSGGVTVSGGTLAMGTFSDTVGAITLTSGSITGSTGVLTGTSYGMQSGSASAILGGAGVALTKTTAGTITLSGTNTFTGVTTINAGTLSVATIGNGGVAGNLGQATNAAGNLVLGGGTLQYTGATASTNRNFTLTTGTTSSFDVSAGATNLTISGASTNTTGGLTKLGAGTLTLSGTNLYTGATTINAGTLSVATIGNGGVAGNLGQATNAAGNLVLGGGTLQYTGATASTNRNFTLTTGTTSSIDVSTGATNLTISGASTNTTGSLTKLGAGTLTLSGTNLYTGTTTVNAGTLMAQGSASLGDTAGNVTVSAGTLSLAGGAAITVLNPTSAVTITKSGTLSLSGSGATASTGALHAAGSTGQTSQWIGNITLAGNATISAADNLLIVGNGITYATTLNLNGNTLTFNTTSATGVTPVYLTAPSYLLDSSNILFNSQLTGSGGIVKTGAGTVNLISFPSNSYTGSTLVTGGKLIIDGAGDAPVISSTSVTVGNSVAPGSADTVLLQMGQTAGQPSVNNLIGTYNNITNVASTSMTVNADGMFNLNGGSNALVNLTLTGGHVNGGDPLSIYNPLLTITGGITSNASTQTAVIDNGHLGMSANAFVFNVANGAAATDLRIDAIVENGVGFTNTNTATSFAKTNGGTLTLTGTNTYQGVTDIQGGILNIQNGSALGQTSPSIGSLSNGTTVQTGAQLQLQGNITVGSETLTLSGTGLASDGALLNNSGSNTYNGFIFLAANSRINANAGSTLTIANPGGTGAGIINGTAAGRSLTVGGGGDTAINSAIGGNIGTLTKDGTGTLTLAGGNSYTGATAVTAGAVKVTNNNGLAGTGVTVTSGAALQFARDAGGNDIAVAAINANLAGTGISSGGAIQNLNGNNSYAGNLTLGANAQISADTGSSLTLGGSVTGAGFALDARGAGNTTYNGVISGAATAFAKNDSGTVTLGGASANTYTGTTSVNDGTLALNKTAGVNALASTVIAVGNGAGAANSATLLLSQSNQIADAAAVTVNSDGLFNVNSQVETVGSIAGSGNILLGTGQLIAGGNNSSTAYAGTLAGSSASIFTKAGTGILTINSNVNAVAGDFAGTLNLTGGGLTFNVDNAFTGTVNVSAGATLKLSDADLSIANLNFNGSGTITLDFSGTASSLSVTNLNIAAGVTLNIINWANAADYFFATNWTGAVVNLTGTTPMNQVIFDAPTWVGNNTKWQGYDHQITPVPEPSSYGALLLGALGAFLGCRRFRRIKAAAK